VRYGRLPGDRIGHGRPPHFALDGDTFRSAFDVPVGLRAAFQELAAEPVEWRLAAYLGRGREGQDAGEDEGEPGEPAGRTATRWGHYLREAMPPLFGETFSEAVWNSGFVKRPGHLFLPVTLEKGETYEAFTKYEDRFLSLGLRRLG
jgi:hypothetical protein